MTTNYETAADVGRDLRKEIVPTMKSKGFNLSISTTKGNYYNDGKISVIVKKVPKNFPVWVDEYSRWQTTINAKRLVETIDKRIDTKLRDFSVLDVDVDVSYDRNIKFIEYEDNTDEN
tara:strand:- start:4477 stop:4830 length:354 start_codon:yes stop_codon:yes gene_type:complete